MKFFKQFFLGVILVNVIFVIGCRAGSNSITQDFESSIDRETSVFQNNDIITIFPTSATLNDVYHDVDSSVIRNGDKKR